MLKPFLLLSAAIILGLAPLAVPAAPPQDSSAAKGAAKASASTDTHTKAKAIYQRDCALCHGDSGDGKTDLAKDMQLSLADWTDPKSLGTKTDQQLFSVIRNGKDKMPSEDVGRAKDDEVKGLVAYIRSLAKDTPPTPTPAAQTTPAPAPTASASGPTN